MLVEEFRLQLFWVKIFSLHVNLKLLLFLLGLGYSLPFVPFTTLSLLSKEFLCFSF